MGIKIHSLAATVAALLLVGTACQTSHPSALLPPAQANAPALTATSSPVDTQDDKIQQSEPAPPASEADLAAELVASVEKEYQSGLANLKAGNRDAARQNFDHAFDLLVASPLNVHSDARLQSEFDRVLAGVNQLEPQDQLSADDADAQKSEPAPIDEANEATAPVDANVKAKAAAEVKVTHSDLPLMMTDEVAGYINYFSGRGRGVLERGLIRSGRYDEMIRRTLKAEGVPQDLIYLAQAESGFHSLALSRVGARGIWQFMAARGRGYGLQRNPWLDERQDPEKATRAAARHLKDLYNEFGDWYLAMAAYNSGPGTVLSAVKRTGYADFWELYKRNVLPKETRNYVPIILAVTIMAKNPAQYGLENLVADKPVPFDTVKIDSPVDLRLVAQCVDTTPATLQDLNPSLLRWTTPKGQSFELHLPAGTKDQYLAAIEPIPAEMRTWWRYHTVSQGDTLASIAHAYRTTPQAIARTNELDTEASLLPDTKLIIPIAPGRHAASEDAASYARHATPYKVRKGDTVQSVADNFGVPVMMVRRWNHLRGESLRGRRVVYVHLPVAPGTVGAQRSSVSGTKSNTASKYKSSKTLLASKDKPVVHHKVQKGETLNSIASVHHTTVQAIRRDNNIASLRPGMILVIRSEP